jgi:hypothetical protein
MRSSELIAMKVNHAINVNCGVTTILVCVIIITYVIEIMINTGPSNLRDIESDSAFTARMQKASNDIVAVNAVPIAYARSTGELRIHCTITCSIHTNNQNDISHMTHSCSINADKTVSIFQRSILYGLVV